MEEQTPLSKKERNKLRRQEKLEVQETIARQRRIKKIVRLTAWGIFGVALIGGFGWFISTRPNLPPTNMQGHIEENPKTHIVDDPIPDNIQRHMLEHADGKGKPGVIIQYNCKKYSCEPDLIQKLIDLVKQYPDNVYLSPSGYDGKIILTKLGKSQILDSFDEKIIRNFIQ